MCLLIENDRNHGNAFAVLQINKHNVLFLDAKKLNGRKANRQQLAIIGCHFDTHLVPKVRYNWHAVGYSIKGLHEVQFDLKRAVI